MIGISHKRFAALVASLTMGLTFLTGGVATAEAGAVEVAVEFDKPTYRIAAGCNRAGNDHALNGTGPGWGDLAYLAGGVTVEAGQTKTFEVSETVPDAARASGYVEVSCDFGYAIDGPTDNPHAGDEAKVSE